MTSNNPTGAAHADEIDPKPNAFAATTAGPGKRDIPPKPQSLDATPADEK